MIEIAPIKNCGSGELDRVRDNHELPSNKFDEHNNKFPDLSKKISEDYEDLLVDENEVNYLIINNKRLKQVTIRLNRELARIRTENTKANNGTIKELRVEIKKWRKQLGQERSLKLKLEKKLEQIKTSQIYPNSPTSPLLELIRKRVSVRVYVFVSFKNNNSS